MTRYLEDFEPGQKFGSGRLAVDAARIKSLADEFDPQPFHLDEDSARETFFKGLAASGWHTAAVTMRLLVEGELKTTSAAKPASPRARSCITSSVKTPWRSPRRTTGPRSPGPFSRPRRTTGAASIDHLHRYIELLFQPGKRKGKETS